MIKNLYKEGWNSFSAIGKFSMPFYFFWDRSLQPGFSLPFITTDK